MAAMPVTSFGWRCGPVFGIEQCVSKCSERQKHGGALSTVSRSRWNIHCRFPMVQTLKWW
jgi:hypothetical protein